MSLKWCPWYGRSSKRRTDASAHSDLHNNLPPLKPHNIKPANCVHVICIPSANIPLQKGDLKARILAAAAACTTSATAITARALAENPDAATAMAVALERIKKTTTTILTSRGIPPNTPTANSIWAAVLEEAACEAGVIAGRPDEPEFASQEAARYERSVVNGVADEIAIASR
ncbi:hypothetical protein KVR01_010499 [Diaporthe batatas]|uniref:uncharacterized protein n=1 Tax=Diaporthe batatas TaxID=748121 RepID=UPI001D047E17|nr:uncharacterized protein KVR01_010499 [Diaporthe batatas]KAG8159862.1 hypothetical protein KVR01_010499 [Diaporthe batatas]